jgi:hypothetical protein
MQILKLLLSWPAHCSNGVLTSLFALAATELVPQSIIHGLPRLEFRSYVGIKHNDVGSCFKALRVFPALTV